MQRQLFRKELDRVVRVREPQGKKDRVNLLFNKSSKVLKTRVVVLVFQRRLSTS